METLPMIVPRAHDLTILPVHFADVLDGSKRAELRNNDRGFQPGDLLLLREWIDDAHASNYSGRFVIARVTHILYGRDVVHGSPAIDAGFVMLSIDVVATDGKRDV